MSNQNKAMYVFSKSAKAAIVKARTYIGDDALVQILKCAFDQIDTPPTKNVNSNIKNLHDKSAMSRVLQIFSGKPGADVVITSDENSFGVEKELTEKDRLSYTEVDIYSAIQEAARADITGFILEALQLCSNEPISLHDADVLSEYINKCKEVIGLANDDKGVG